MTDYSQFATGQVKDHPHSWQEFTNNCVRAGCYANSNFASAAQPCPCPWRERPPQAEAVTSNERTHDIPDFERWMLQLAWYHGVGCTVRLPLAQCSCGLHGLISRIRQERTDRLAGETTDELARMRDLYRTMGNWLASDNTPQTWKVLKHFTHFYPQPESSGQTETSENTSASQLRCERE